MSVFSWSRVLNVAPVDSPIGFVGVARIGAETFVAIRVGDTSSVPATVYKSTDNGRTWSLLGDVIGSGNVGNTSTRSCATACSPGTDKVFWAQRSSAGAGASDDNDGIIVRSTDGGATWSIAREGVNGDFYSQATADFGGGQVVVVGSSDSATDADPGNTAFTFYSSDGGATWIAPVTSWVVDGAGYPFSVASAGGGVGYLGMSWDGFAGSFVLHIYRTTDNGRTWAIGAALPTTGTLVPSSRFTTNVSAIACEGSTVLAAGNKQDSDAPLYALWRSTDNGTSFSQVDLTGVEGMADNAYPTSILSLGDGKFVLAFELGGSSLLILYSSDGGATWTPEHVDTDDVAIFQMAVTSTGDIIAVGINGITGESQIWLGESQGGEVEGVFLRIGPSDEVLAQSWHRAEFWRSATESIDDAVMLDTRRAFTLEDHPGVGHWCYWSRLISVADKPGEFSSSICVTLSTTGGGGGGGSDPDGGVIEELTIEPDLDGNPDVWFRNKRFVGNFGLVAKLADEGISLPIRGVTWGVDGTSFMTWTADLSDINTPRYGYQIWAVARGVPPYPDVAIPRVPTASFIRQEYPFEQDVTLFNMTATFRKSGTQDYARAVFTGWTGSPDYAQPTYDPASVHTYSFDTGEIDVEVTCTMADLVATSVSRDHAIDDSFSFYIFNDDRIISGYVGIKDRVLDKNRHIVLMLHLDQLDIGVGASGTTYAVVQSDQTHKNVSAGTEETPFTEQLFSNLSSGFVWFHGHAILFDATAGTLLWTTFNPEATLDFTSQQYYPAANIRVYTPGGAVVIAEDQVSTATVSISFSFTTAPDVVPLTVSGSKSYGGVWKSDLVAIDTIYYGGAYPTSPPAAWPGMGSPPPRMWDPSVTYDIDDVVSDGNFTSGIYKSLVGSNIGNPPYNETFSPVNWQRQALESSGGEIGGSGPGGYSWFRSEHFLPGSLSFRKINPGDETGPNPNPTGSGGGPGYPDGNDTTYPPTSVDDTVTFDGGTDRSITRAIYDRTRMSFITDALDAIGITATTWDEPIETSDTQTDVVLGYHRSAAGWLQTSQNPDVFRYKIQVNASSLVTETSYMNNPHVLDVRMLYFDADDPTKTRIFILVFMEAYDPVITTDGIAAFVIDGAGTLVRILQNWVPYDEDFDQQPFLQWAQVLDASKTHLLWFADNAFGRFDDTRTRTIHLLNMDTGDDQVVGSDLKELTLHAFAIRRQGAYDRPGQVFVQAWDPDTGVPSLDQSAGGYPIPDPDIADKGTLKAGTVLTAPKFLSAILGSDGFIYDYVQRTGHVLFTVVSYRVSCLVGDRWVTSEPIVVEVPSPNAPPDYSAGSVTLTWQNPPDTTAIRIYRGPGGTYGPYQNDPVSAWPAFELIVEIPTPDETFEDTGYYPYGELTDPNIAMRDVRVVNDPILLGDRAI